jgi:hypothetical protein
MSGPDNSGATILTGDFHLRQLVVPALTTRSPLEKTMPELAALSGAAAVSWRRGQSVELAPGVRVEVLHPAADSPETRADDRALVLLFHAGDQTLLWAGRIGPQAQADILAAYPGLHADVLVMGADPPPGQGWLEALQVRDWLQIPPRDQRLNSTAQPVDAGDSCQVWPLVQTGAVDLHFQSGANGQPPRILLRPWLALPAGN